MELINATSSPLLEQKVITRSQKGIVKPNPKYARISNYLSISEPNTFKNAFSNPLWLRSYARRVTNFGTK